MIGVLTADLVGSTRLDSSSYHTTVNGLADYLSSLKKHTALTFSVYRGDEFQVAFGQPEQACKLTLQLKSWLASGHTVPPIQCTMSLAFDHGEMQGADPGVNNGPAYIKSGRKLETLRSAELLIQTAGDQHALALQIICQQLSYIMNRHSVRQAELVHQYLASDFATHQSLAEQLGTSRQNVSERLRAAGADLLPETITYINSLLQSPTTE